MFYNLEDSFKESITYGLRYNLETGVMILEKITSIEGKLKIAERRTVDAMPKLQESAFISSYEDYKSDVSSIENIADKPYISAHCDLFF